MPKKNLIYSIFLLVISCSNPEPKVVIVDGNATERDAEVVADSIKYEVVVMLTDDSAWDAERLKGYTNHKALVDGIITNVLNGKLKAYDYNTDELLTPEEVKNILDEKAVDASKIGKLLFAERWYIDSRGSLLKKITSITLGYAEYSKQGTFKGYSALFKVKY